MARPRGVVRSPHLAAPRDLCDNLVVDRRLAEMSVTSDILVGTEGLTQVLQMLAARALELTSADYAALAAFDDDGVLERFAYAGIDEATARRIGPPPRGRGLLSAPLDQSAPIRCDAVADDPRFTGFPPYHPPIGPFLGVPIHAGGRTIGSISVGRSPDGEPFSADNEDSARFLALQAATAVSLAVARERSSRIALLEERASIANDLHDGTIQALYALGLEIDAQLRQPDTPTLLKERLARGIDRINEVIADIRQYISMLEAHGASSLPDLAHDLPFTLRQLVPPGIDTVLNISAAALLEVNSRQAEDLLYIAREAISNAVRHSGGTRIAVDLRQSDDEVALTLQDNGTGYEPATARVGLGTVSMRTRAERLGADLRVVSIPGMGTMVRVSIPRLNDD